MKGFLILFVIMMGVFLWYSGGDAFFFDWYEHILWTYTTPGAL